MANDYKADFEKIKGILARTDKFIGGLTSATIANSAKMMDLEEENTQLKEELARLRRK